LQIIKKIKEYWLSLDKIDKYIILLLVFSFLIRITFLTYSPLRGWDETVYMNLGSDLSHNPFFYSLEKSGWNDFISIPEPVYEWPNIGFRAPLLPYLLSIFYSLNLIFLIPFLIPFFATLSVFLVYILGKNMFNKKIGFYGATLFSLVPINILSSEKIWTDSLVVFFLLLTFISFWKGYEKNDNKHKVFFGIFLALSLMTRYTTLWITPVFLLYFLIRDKSLKFMLDKYLWRAILSFFVVLIPWFIYGCVFYQNPIGGFIHGFKAAAYWGGVQSWSFFIDNSWLIFSIIGWLFLFSIIYIFYKKEFLRRDIYLLLLWSLFFSSIVMAMPHKEERFITPIIPAICLISAFFVYQLKKYKNIFFIMICLTLLYSSYLLYKANVKESLNTVNICFSSGNNFLATETGVDSLIITNQDSIVHYYTQRDTIIYPKVWSLKNLKTTIDVMYPYSNVYVYFSNYDMYIPSRIKNDLDENFEKIYECNIEIGHSYVYKYR